MMDPGTNTLIIALPHNNFWAGNLADGQWHSLRIDLKPLIQQAFDFGKTVGAVATYIATFLIYI